MRQVTRGINESAHFAAKGADEKEYRFVSQALATMVDGKILFSLVPLGALFGRA